MKNKKLVAMVTALAIGGTLLVGTSFAALAETSGYDVYKTAVKNTKDIKNATAAVTATVSDNNAASPLLTVNANLLMDKNKDALSSKTEFKTSAFDKTEEIYSENGKTIMKSSDSNVYTVNEHMGKMNKINKTEENPEVSQSIEGLIDAVVGDKKNNFTIKQNSDGTKLVTVNLSQNDITPIENAAVNLVFKLSGAHEFNRKSANQVPDIKDIVPQLKNDIKVESVIVTATIDKNNRIVSQDTKVSVSGTDADGKSHNVAVDVNADLSNIGSTTPATIDLTGKNVKTIPSGYHRDTK